MRIAAVMFAAAMAGWMVGCQSNTVSPKPDDVNDTIDHAVAMGADIPPDKRPLVVRMLQLDEKDLVLGLRTYAELSGGHYPTKLDAKSTLKQVETDRLGASRSDLSESRKKEMLQDIFFASTFYDKLVREGHSVQYHGDTVSRQDAGKILVAWNSSKQQFRVILGDLSARTLSTQQFSELARSP